MKTKKGCLNDILNEGLSVPIDLLFDILKWTYGRLKELGAWLRKRIAKWRNECHRLRGKENIECNIILIKESRKKLEKELQNCKEEDCKKIEDFLKKLKVKEDELNMKLKAYK